MPQSKYTPAELDHYALQDLISDAEQSEHQAEHGPFYPENGVTREMCLAYAARCRAAIERYKDGGAHKAVLAGNY
jgi:hypothetical protein